MMGHPYGKTSPWYNLADHYDISYVAILLVADYVLHGRKRNGESGTHAAYYYLKRFTRYADIMRDVNAIATEQRAIRAGEVDPFN